MNDEQSLDDLIPKSVDDIVRANRDKCRLAWATEDELKGLACDLRQALGSPRHILRDWNILMIHAMQGKVLRSVPRLLGVVSETGQPWITSAVRGFDSKAGLIQTENSLYGVDGPRASEPDTHTLIHVCVWLNQYGCGPYLGVPAFFY